ncbi:hypothetical protein B0H21DRAFT_21208 [Amylocystis lapponica]|nr:hypothetical protein B0H21DRAFT_21208 [Amylocystis lapponica]
MPRIRKKTSKRSSTDQRERRKHQVKESKRKTKKAAKKNPQWKSKHPKDPGIPNNFPYKDQILAEVAEERRKAAEEKERRKQEKKAAKGKAASADGSDDEAVFDGVTGVTARTHTKAAGADTPMDVDTEVPEDEVPVLINHDLPTLQSVLDRADVVLQIVDARDPLRSRSTHIEELSQGKKMLLVLSKIDTCPREAAAGWAATLRTHYPTVLFRSASAFLPAPLEPVGKGKGKERADDAWGIDSILACLHAWAQEQEGDAPLVVAVVGVTNAGKSAFVNSLLRKAALPTYHLSSAALDGPTTTTHAQEVTLEIDGKQLRLVDTPGLSWLPAPDQSEEEIERTRARDILLRSRGRIERLKDPVPVVAEIVARADREDLMLFYNLAAFADGDANAFLSGVARSNGLVKKGGVLDLAGASRIVLRDWSTGKFPRYTMPPSPAPTPAPGTEAALAEIYAKDEQILGGLAIRKELRRRSGVVKLAAAEAETRRLVLDMPWVSAEHEDVDYGDEEEGEAMEDAEGDGSDKEDDEEDAEDGSAEEDEEDEDEDEDEAPVPPSVKRKRGPAKATPAPARPVKKVAFSVDPKSSKQARSAAGKKPSRAALRNAKTKDQPTVGNEATAARPTLKVPLKAKSALKKTPVATGKAAKASSVSKKGAAPRQNDGEEAYDFKKFF